MTDNTTLNAGSGGDVIATDDIAGVKFQRVKVTFGADGVATDVASGAPLPVTGPLTDTQLRATAVPVSGTFWQATQPVSGPLTDTELRATAVPVSGTFFQATQPISGTVSVSGSVSVTGTFFQATQPVSGTVTANAGTGTFAMSAVSLPLPSGAATSAKQPALGTAGTASADVLSVQGIASMTALKVDGSAVTQPVSGTVAVTGTFWQATQPVSGTFWQATQPVSAASLPLPSGAATSAKQDTLAALLPASLGQKAKASSLAVAIASDQDTLAVSGSATVAIGTSFTRPADTTAYVSGDLVANSTTAGSVTVLSFANSARTSGGSGMIRRVRLRKSGTSVTNTSFRLHLFNASPATVTNGDNGAFSVSGSADYIGAFDITIDRAFTDGAVGVGAPVSGGEVNFKLPSGTTIYGYIEARAAYTPTSGETFAPTLEIIQD
jgi:hypothetical protein